MTTSGIAAFDAVIRSVDTATLVVREADAAIAEHVDDARLRFAAEQALSTNASDSAFSIEVGSEHAPDAKLAEVLSEMRLVKDAYEIEQMRLAVDATQRGFDDVSASSSAPPRRSAASASSRASSTPGPGSTATPSATTRSRHPEPHATASCTGPATTAP